MEELGKTTDMIEKYRFKCRRTHFSEKLDRRLVNRKNLEGFAQFLERNRPILQKWPHLQSDIGNNQIRPSRNIFAHCSKDIFGTTRGKSYIKQNKDEMIPIKKSSDSLYSDLETEPFEYGYKYKKEVDTGLMQQDKNSHVKREIETICIEQETRKTSVQKEVDTPRIKHEVRNTEIEEAHTSRIKQNANIEIELIDPCCSRQILENRPTQQKVDSRVVQQEVENIQIGQAGTSRTQKYIEKSPIKKFNAYHVQQEVENNTIEQEMEVCNTQGVAENIEMEKKAVACTIQQFEEKKLIQKEKEIPMEQEVDDDCCIQEIEEKSYTEKKIDTGSIKKIEENIPMEQDVNSGSIQQANENILNENGSKFQVSEKSLCEEKEELESFNPAPEPYKYGHIKEESRIKQETEHKKNSQVKLSDKCLPEDEDKAESFGPAPEPFQYGRIKEESERIKRESGPIKQEGKCIKPETKDIPKVKDAQIKVPETLLANEDMAECFTPAPEPYQYGRVKEEDSRIKQETEKNRVKPEEIIHIVE